MELSRENVAANRAALGARALRQLCCSSRVREKAAKEERIRCANERTRLNQAGLTAKGRERPSKGFLVPRTTDRPKVKQAQSHGHAPGAADEGGKRLEATRDPKSPPVFLSLTNPWRHQLWTAQEAACTIRLRWNKPRQDPLAAQGLSWGTERSCGSSRQGEGPEMQETQARGGSFAKKQRRSRLHVRGHE